MLGDGPSEKQSGPNWFTVMLTVLTTKRAAWRVAIAVLVPAATVVAVAIFLGPVGVGTVITALGSGIGARQYFRRRRGGEHGPGGRGAR